MKRNNFHLDPKFLDRQIRNKFLFAGLTLIGISFLGLASCNQQDQTTKKLTDNKAPEWLHKCPDFSVTGKSPVAGNAECGTLDVLENQNDPTSQKISLNILRVASINPTPQPDPLFIIAGGPGQSAVDVAAFITPLFAEVRKNRDLIFVDQRGTGHSNPFDCPALESDEQSSANQKNNSRVSEQQYIDDAVRTCVEKYGDHLRYYATPFAVNDLNEVRKQLGYNKINLWGASYGTRVAIEYMREFPEYTRAAILDGVAPLDIALPSNMDKDSSAALAAIDAQCSSDPECKFHFGELIPKAQKIAQALQQMPLDIEIRHPRTQKKEMTKINGDDFSGLIRHMLYDRDMSTLIPQIISDTAQGDYQLLGSLLFLAKAKTELKSINQTMHYAVVCSEDYVQYEKRLMPNFQLQDNEAFLNSHAVQTYARVCAKFPKAELPKNYFDFSSKLKNPSDPTPTLILSGAQDPVTPPRWAELVKSRLPAAVSVVAPGGHHGISMQGCGSQLIALFIERGNAQGLETKCIQSIKPLAIHLPTQASTSSAQNTQSSAASSQSNSSRSSL